MVLLMQLIRTLKGSEGEWLGYLSTDRINVFLIGITMFGQKIILIEK